MPRYLLIEVGCIECGDPTFVDRIVEADDPPPGYRVLAIGEEAELRYDASEIAVPLFDEDPFTKGDRCFVCYVERPRNEMTLGKDAYVESSPERYWCPEHSTEQVTEALYRIRAVLSIPDRPATG